MGVTSSVSGDGWVVGIFASGDQAQRTRRVFVGIWPLASSEFTVMLAECEHVTHRTDGKVKVVLIVRFQIAPASVCP